MVLRQGRFCHPEDIWQCVKTVWEGKEKGNRVGETSVWRAEARDVVRHSAMPKTARCQKTVWSQLSILLRWGYPSLESTLFLPLLE